MTARNYILNKIVQYPHIAVRIKFYPERLFGNINIVIYLLIFKYGYPVNPRYFVSAPQLQQYLYP